MLRLAPAIAGFTTAAIVSYGLMSFASHMAESSGFAACFDAIGDAAHCREWTAAQNSAPTPCTTDSDCMNKNPHLGDF